MRLPPPAPWGVCPLSVTFLGAYDPPCRVACFTSTMTYVLPRLRASWQGPAAPRAGAGIKTTLENRRPLGAVLSASPFSAPALCMVLSSRSLPLAVLPAALGGSQAQSCLALVSAALAGLPARDLLVGPLAKAGLARIWHAM